MGKSLRVSLRENRLNFVESEAHSWPTARTVVAISSIRAHK